jgi:peptide/nickel transport system substrate-binding protein
VPYLDGIKYYIITDDGARAKSIRSDRTDVEFRGFPPAEVDAITGQMGDKVMVAYPGQPTHWGIAFNVDKKPYDDERVRQAMSLAIDRYDMAKTLTPLTGLDTVSGLIPPHAPWALTPEELQQLPGFGKDSEANLKEAKRLLAEAGYPNGFKTVLMNRSIKLPYIDMGVYLVSAWKKVGIEAEHKLEESASWTKSRHNRDFEVMVDPFGTVGVADPDELLVKFTTGSFANYGRFSEPVADKLFHLQKVELDEQKRVQLARDMQKEIMKKAWWLPGLWWTRAEVRSSRIRNYEPQPNHWMNRRLEDVWLAEK